MDDDHGSRRLAVVEKRPETHRRQRHCGCMGVFCQLFERNSKRFAKKKLNLLSSGGLVGSGRAQLAADAPNANRSLSFRADGRRMKMMDLFLHQNHQMTAPSLVARLMGLESIPVTLVIQNQPKPKPSNAPKSGPSRCHKGNDIILGDARLQNKPQLRKKHQMRQFGFQGLARCGRADSLALRTVSSSCSRKHYHHQAKLPTLMKCARVGSGRNNSAAQILEHRCRVTKGKANVITNYSHLVHHDLNQQGVKPSRFKNRARLNGEEIGLQKANADLHATSHDSSLQKANDMSDLTQGVKGQSLQRMLKRIDDVSHTTPERKRKINHGNVSALKPLFSINRSISIARSKAENPMQHRSLEKAHLKHYSSADGGSTLGLTENISFMLDKLGHYGTAPEKKLIHFKDVILHVGLLLENGVLNKPKGGKKFSICRFFEQLEGIASAMWSGSIALPGFWKLRSRNQLMWILFDLAVEYLDSSFANNYELPLRVTVQQLILGLNYEIVRWANLRGNTANKLAELEVTHSSGILSDYENEAVKVCCELDEYLLMGLVEEIVMEVYEINLVRNCSMSWARLL